MRFWSAVGVLSGLTGWNRACSGCAADFRRRLRVPETAVAVLNETLAHELGRIRLHAQQPVKGVKVGLEQKKEAGDYARTFLVPLVVLVTRLPISARR